MATRIPLITQSCDKVADCGEPAEWEYEDGAKLCVYHAQERDGTLPPTVTDLQRELQQAQERGKQAWEQAIKEQRPSANIYSRLVDERKAAEALVKRGKHLLALVLAGASLPGVGLQAGIEDFLGYTRAPAEAQGRQAR